MKRPLTRREFLTLFKAETARATLVEPRPTARCRQCAKSFFTAQNESVCPICRTSDARRTALAAELSKHLAAPRE